MAAGFDELTLVHQQKETQLLANSLSFSNEAPPVLAEGYSNQTNSIYLVNSQGKYLYHPDSTKKGTTINDDFSPEIVAWILDGMTGATIETGTGRVIGLAPVKGQDTILITVNTNSRSKGLLSAIRRSSQIQLFTGLVITSIVGGIAIWIVVGLPVW